MTDRNGSADEKTPVEQAMEVFVYAPIGLLFEGSTLLPQLVEKGRNQVTMARMLGKFAVEQGRAEATKTATKLGDQAAGLLDFLGDSLASAPTEPSPPPPAPAPLPSTRPVSSGRAAAAAKTSAKPAAAAAVGQAAAPTVVSSKPASRKPASSRTASRKGAAQRPAPAAPGAVPEVASLSIPDYDGLSASHVVNRLAGLSAEELEAVRRYEAANRGRKTILSKIAQLQSA